MKQVHIDAKHIKGDFYVAFVEYATGGTCITLRDDTEGPAAVATVRLPNNLPNNHVWMKGWSENEGLPEALEKAGIVQLLPIFVNTGFVQAQMAKVLITSTQE